ncbi:MAG: hypothetical protein P3W94_005955 [Paracoccus sp. (in: a-proteobacteria)]|nr:hypothetical protein [Paracoccus sp. (in: a-proteobacteria)]
MRDSFEWGQPRGEFCLNKKAPALEVARQALQRDGKSPIEIALHLLAECGRQRE